MRWSVHLFTVIVAVALAVGCPGSDDTGDTSSLGGGLTGFASGGSGGGTAPGDTTGGGGEEVDFLSGCWKPEAVSLFDCTAVCARIIQCAPYERYCDEDCELTGLYMPEETAKFMKACVFERECDYMRADKAIDDCAADWLKLHPIPESRTKTCTQVEKSVHSCGVTEFDGVCTQVAQLATDEAFGMIDACSKKSCATIVDCLLEANCSFNHAILTDIEPPDEPDQPGDRHGDPGGPGSSSGEGGTDVGGGTGGVGPGDLVCTPNSADPRMDCDAICTAKSECGAKANCGEQCGLVGGYLSADAAVVMEGCIQAVACDAYVGISGATLDCLEPTLAAAKGSTELCSQLKEAMSSCEPDPEVFEALCNEVVPLLGEVALAKVAACKNEACDSIRGCTIDRSCLLSILGPEEDSGQKPE